jgi:hypothetical protein
MITLIQHRRRDHYPLAPMMDDDTVAQAIPDIPTE